jgi:hypothetical protein
LFQIPRETGNSTTGPYHILNFASSQFDMNCRSDIQDKWPAPQILSEMNLVIQLFRLSDSPHFLMVGIFGAILAAGLNGAGQAVAVNLAGQAAVQTLAAAAGPIGWGLSGVYWAYKGVRWLMSEPTPTPTPPPEEQWQSSGR